MLEVIGYLVTKFPGDVEDSLPSLLSWIEDALEKQFSSNSPEMLLVNGLLFSLARLLVCDRGRYEKDEATRKKIYSCSNAVFEVLSAYMLVEKDDVRKKCLNRILKEVLPVINDPGADTAALGFAIQCLGWFARPIGVFLGAKGHNKIEERLKKFGENLLALDAKATASRWSLFSQYVRCIGQFVREQDQDVPLDDGYVNFLGNLLCHLMTAYPRCLWKSKVMVHKSIIAVFDAVSKRTVLEPLVDRFVFHTLLLSISNITSPEDMIALYHPDTGEMETKLVYEYEGFWLALLRRGEKKYGRVATVTKEGSGSDDVEMEDVEASRRTLQAVIFDSVVKKVLAIIEQLDLSYKHDLQTTNNGKNASGYLQIPQLLHLVFVSATKMPLVSSFYRIGTMLAMTIDELQYFDASMDLEGVRHDDARACLRGEFAYFVAKVCSQIRFYQDELLVACAAFVLATPVGLFPIDAAGGVLKSVLELGRSFLPAASIAITALERWQRQCPEEIGLIIGEIVPLLAPYLDQSAANDTGSLSVNTEAAGSSDFSRLQHRVMVFLGNSGGKVSLLMSEPPSVVNPDGVIGDTSMQHFQLSLDLNGVAVPLALDTIFKYLGELAIQSTDRRVKASASEGYHALICYLCGKTATRPHAGGKKSVFYELWRKAFSNIVLLATDPEKICRALFEPLLFQLLRWFASNSDGFPFEYANLLDQLVRGLSDPENSAVRALSGRGIATLLTLSLEGQASGSVVEKLLQSFVYQSHAWADDEHTFDEIRAFCSGVVAHNKDWAREMQRCAEVLLLPLSTCLAEVNSEDDYIKRAREIRALCIFGNEVLSTNILQQDVASRHDTVFALAANKSIKFGRSLPDHLRIAVLALKAATACGWDITTIFVSDAGRRAYGAVHNDVIHFIPTLVVWRQCAKSLVALALTNPRVLNVLVDALDQVASFKFYKTGSAELDSFVETLLPSIKNFVENLGAHTSDTQQTLLLLEALRLLLQLCQHCSKRLVEPLSMGPLPDIRDAVLELLKQRECSYLVKADILRILALLSPSSSLVAEEDEGPMKIVEALVSFVVDDFPIVSTDVTRGSKDFDVFRVLFVGLLAVIEQSKSVAYLRIIFPSLKERQSHLFFEEIKLSLGRFSNGLAVTKSGGANKNDKVLLELVKLTDILLDSSEDTAIRKTLLEAVFTPLIELQPVDTLQRFYLKESLAAKAVLVGMLATKISTSADATSAASRFGVSVAFALVEILYRLADPEFIRNNINAAFLGHKNGKGREFTMLVCKCASKVATTYGGGDEVTRLACCQAYSCLLTAVSRTQKQEKFFDQILFQDSVWNNIVDNSREYELHAETKEFEKVPLSSFSTASLQSQRETNAGRGASSALKFFTASSLSLDSDTLSVSMTSPVGIDQGGAMYHNLEIELDALNEHPCMVPLLRVLMQMKTDFGSNWDETAMPGWMKKLFGVMESTSTELNVRLFLAKVVLNVPDVFTPYALSWLEKVLDTLLEATVSTSAGSGGEFHYLLRDCCNLVLDAWKDISVASMRGTASRFLNTLVELCPHRVNFIRDDNVLLASQLILLWKDSVSIDVQLLASQLFSDDDNARMQVAKQYTSLQLISAMVTAGQASDLHSELGFVEGQTIEGGILLAMKNKKASLFVVAAEVGGLYSTKAKQGGTFKHELVALITSAYNEEDFGRFLALLRNASLHQPDIIDATMLHRLSFVLPKVIAVDAWSLLAMETLGNATANEKVAAEIFPHVQSVLDRFIAHRHAGVQYSTLQAVTRIVDHLTKANLERLIKNVSQGGLGLLEYFEVHEDAACRHLIFGIARQLQKRDIALSIKERVTCALLQGLCDPDANLRREQSEYWSASDLVPATCSNRLLAVLGVLHFPEFADKWVLYATNLLVGMSKESDQFDRALFPSALGSGDFTEAHIDATWEAKNPTMTPMFSIEADQFGLLLGAPQSDIYEPAAKKFFQDQHAMEKKRQEARSNRERSEQQGRVDMRRKYRVGEFPDIQITQRDLVEPIMALCETHSQTSSIVFAALFSSVMASKAFEQPSDSSALAKNIERSLLLSKSSSVYVCCVELAYLASLVNNEKLFGKLVVPPNTIGIAGLASGNNPASQLLLEEFLICNARRDSGQTNLTSRDWTATCWDQLHKILGAINKSNFLIALSSTCSTTDESKLALQAQLSGDLPAAVASYKKADNVLASQIEGGCSVAAQSDASRCYWQRMDCLETLNNWDTLMLEIDDATTQDNGFLWSQESPYLEQGVGHYLRSCLGLVAKSRDGESSALGRLQQFVDSVVADSAKQELVNSRFPVEKCLAYLAMGDSNQARVCVENFYREFLAKWRHASGIATSIRSELMQSLSSMVEIDEILGLVRDGEHHVVKVSGQRETEHLAFVHKWVEAAPFTGEGGLTAWSQFAMVQNYVGGFLLEHGLDQGILSDGAQLSLLREKGSVMLKYATAALSGDILALASKNLKDYRELCNAHKLPKVSVEMVEVFVSHVLKLADRQLKQKRSDLTSSSIKLITRYYETATKMFDNVEMMEMMETVDTDDRVAMGYLEAKTFASAAEFYAVSNANDGLKEEYFSRALDVFQQSCKLIGATSEVADNKLGGGERKAFSRCRLTFIEFLADLLIKDGGEKWDQLVDQKLATQLLVDNVLGGMARGDHDARQKVELLWKDCFSPDRPRLGGQIGRYNRDWSRNAKRDVEKLLGKNGSNMTVKTVTAAREWIMNHFSVTPGRYGITKDMKAQLGDFSEWLEEFDHSSCSLELPGQYTTYWGKPDPSTHIRILSFDSMLGVLASKQLPKRLTLHCSDEKEYTFLVKGGEDLRLDQRIEQLFDVMNQILAVDSRCRDRNLSTRTYKVIPMTQEIGIIEWLHCTSTLKGVIETQLQKDDRCASLQSNKRQKLELFNTSAAKAYESFLLKQRGASFSAKVIAPQSSEVVDQFSKVQALIPGDLLRRQLLGLGSDFQAFLLVRDHFLKSLAVFSACSYVLGIGDRHLDNFLLDHTNGRVIGIDFGVSFGAGASVLPVPELVPFRYTRQMAFVFEPYDGANLLAQDMQAVFEALRAKKQVIESVMDVFLHEPLMDWQQSTTIHQKGLIQESEGTEIPTLQDSDVEMKEEEEPRRARVPRSDKKAGASIPSEAGATAWLPDVKIAIARRKLEGFSPKLLLKEELAQNLHLSRQLGKFHSLIDSACGSDGVATGSQEMAAMSSLAQAQELLALATSPDLLGRTYHGWMPWL
ncbi:hypothetical protein BBJ28_00001056 [Nothophytophthora sp. Chile5]|nr:hypothetical protein BBJ28_00001056 [Nothophytophthora sp. Chile5]